mmetsp:Transcript_11440/g.31268  ORF Transcript_11440/g.31268 Transcript_11440/m.31268 type:complete len:282 (-) Transcript_11440:877-1722(-)
MSRRWVRQCFARWPAALLHSSSRFRQRLCRLRTLDARLRRCRFRITPRARLQRCHLWNLRARQRLCHLRNLRPRPVAGRSASGPCPPSTCGRTASASAAAPGPPRRAGATRPWGTARASRQQRHRRRQCSTRWGRAWSYRSPAGPGRAPGSGPASGRWAPCKTRTSSGCHPCPRGSRTSPGRFLLCLCASSRRRWWPTRSAISSRSGPAKARTRARGSGAGSWASARSPKRTTSSWTPLDPTACWTCPASRGRGSARQSCPRPPTPRARQPCPRLPTPRTR